LAVSRRQHAARAPHAPAPKERLGQMSRRARPDPLPIPIPSYRNATAKSEHLPRTSCAPSTGSIRFEPGPLWYVAKRIFTSLSAQFHASLIAGPPSQSLVPSLTSSTSIVSLCIPSFTPSFISAVVHHLHEQALAICLPFASYRITILIFVFGF